MTIRIHKVDELDATLYVRVLGIAMLVIYSFINQSTKMYSEPTLC